MHACGGHRCIIVLMLIQLRLMEHFFVINGMRLPDHVDIMLPPSCALYTSGVDMYYYGICLCGRSLCVLMEPQYATHP